MFNYPTKLIYAGLQEPEADTSWMRSLLCLDPLVLVPQDRMEQWGYVLEGVDEGTRHQCWHQCYQRGGGYTKQLLWRVRTLWAGSKPSCLLAHFLTMDGMGLQTRFSVVIGPVWCLVADPNQTPMEV